MDYQASTSSGKVRYTAHWKKTIWVFLCVTGSLSCVFAQLAENPLTVDINITAEVLAHGGPDTPPNPSPGPAPVDTLDAVIFKGLAYPGSTISVLKNSIVIAELPANTDGTFDMRVRKLPPGTYTFGIRAVDKDNLTSRLLSFTVYISGGIATIIDGIFIPPTITSDKIEVKKSEQITFLGSGAPNAEIRLSLVSLLSKEEVIKIARANASGTWLYDMDSTAFDFGDYEAKARAITLTDFSFYSDPLLFRVGSTTRMRPKGGLFGFRKRCDLNNDGRVNLLDFSIMAFWYKRLGFPDKVDLNTDKRVNLTDLSILAYCWTG